MRVNVTDWRGQQDNIELKYHAKAIFTDTDETRGVAECADKVATQVAGALARLIGILADKGLLSEIDVREIVHDYANERMSFVEGE